jgi:hypothetical protein
MELNKEYSSKENCAGQFLRNIAQKTNISAKLITNCSYYQFLGPYNCCYYKLNIDVTEHRLQLLNVDELVNEAIEAHKAGEIMEVVEVKYSYISYIA